MEYVQQTWFDTAVGGTPLEDSRLNHMEAGIFEGAASHPPVQVSGAYTFALTDIRRVVEITSGTPVNATVPPNSTVPFPVGAMIEVCQIGAGAVTITPGAGVIVRNAGAIIGQWATVGLRKRLVDEWVLTGEIA